MDPISEVHTWDENATKAHARNAKVVNALFCTLSETEYTSASRYSMAQEIWQLLEGTSQVKESKISLLTSQNETFKMEGEIINTKYNRFNDFIVGFQNHGKN